MKMNKFNEKIPLSQFVLIIIWILFLRLECIERANHILNAMYGFCASAVEIIAMVYGFFLLEECSKNHWKRYLYLLLRFVGCIALVQLLIVVKDIGFSVSITWFFDYMKELLIGSNRSYIGIFYIIVLFGIFAPFLSKMLDALSQWEQKILLFLIYIYFAFFTIEVFANFKINIANFPFLNFWGYILVGWLVTNITWNKKEKFFLYIFFILMTVLTGGLYVLMPEIAGMQDIYFVFRLGNSSFLFLLLWRGGKLREENNILLITILVPYLIEVLL